MFDPRDYGVLLPYFDLNIGSLSQIYNKPQLPLAFEFTRTTGDMGSMKLSMFGNPGYEIDNAIYSARNATTGDADGTFQFGWKGDANVDSDVWPFNITDIDPVFDNNAFTVTVAGSACSSLLMSSNQATGTVSEILNKIAMLHNLTLNVDPPLGTAYMLDRGSTDYFTTQKRELKHHKFLNESDWRYVNRLCYYMRDQSGKSGYRPSISVSGGKRVLNIQLCTSQSADYEYTVQDPTSVVVYPGGWRPSVTYAGLNNSMDTHFNGHQGSTGYTSKNAMNMNATKQFQTFPDPGSQNYFQALATPPQLAPKQIVFTCAENIDQSVATNSIRARHQSTSSPFAGINEPLARHCGAWMLINGAQLTIFGDPRIEPMKNVKVNFNYPQNYSNSSLAGTPHYTSGTYLCTEVLHRINPAEGFITVLTLSRPDTGLVQSGTNSSSSS